MTFQNVCWCFQIFTNADREHAAQVLNRLGLEGCFEGVICFETLNPPPEPTEYNEELEGNGVCKEGASEPEDNAADMAESNSFRPRSPILCKPSVEAIEAAIRIANVDPKKTVRAQKLIPSWNLMFLLYLP